FGKGIRSPLRDAMLSDSVPPEAHGRVFGTHRAADTAGAVAGPLLGAWLLSALPRSTPSAPFRTVFLVSLIPGLLSCAAMIFLVEEKRVAGDRTRKLWKAMRDLPRPYRRFLAAVGIFGCGEFAPTLLIMAAIQLLGQGMGLVRAGEIGALLYTLRNAAQALSSFPAGVLADRVNKRRLLAAGYGLGGVTALAAGALFAWQFSSLPAIAAVFLTAGAYAGIHDALEGAIPAGMIRSEDRGTAYGLLGAVNGVGDLIASALVGTLWTAVSPVVAFVSAGVLMLAGAAAMAGLAE
ncbi:MAG TPA: MFS transporter, partial [Candidatus Sulfopaludibacter sp.]|nr:MFS transporter [Candidatus Sulfopaludibacter sp.]